MKTGDVVFVRGKSLLARLVRLFDKGKFSHVAIFISDTKIIEAYWNTKVRIVDFHHDLSDCEIVPLNLNKGEKFKMGMLTNKLEGKKYDFKQIVKILFRIIFRVKGFKHNSPKEVICSELVGRYLVLLGKAEKKVKNMTVNELYEYLKSRGY